MKLPRPSRATIGPMLHSAFRRCALLFACLFVSSTAQAAELVTVGTVAPKHSIWGRVFGVWEQAVAKKSDGKLELKVFYNATQGDDGAMIGKLKAGQLDAAAVSSIGLAQIHKPVLVLQMPGVFRSWDALDKARAALKPEFDKAFAKEGFVVGWGDLGRLRGMSRGFAVRKPGDLRGRKVLNFRNDVIGPTVYQVVDGATVVPASASEILPLLKKKNLDVISAPSLAAEQLQWAPELDHIGKDSTVIAIGGMVWSKKRLDGLPGDLRKILEDTGKVAEDALRKKIRNEDDLAFDRLSKKMTVVELSDAEREVWKGVFKRVIARLKQGTFEPDLVDRVVGMSG